jgi:hypothetical protein
MFSGRFVMLKIFPRKNNPSASRQEHSHLQFHRMVFADVALVLVDAAGGGSLRSAASSRNPKSQTNAKRQANAPATMAMAQIQRHRHLVHNKQNEDAEAVRL